MPISLRDFCRSADSNCQHQRDYEQEPLVLVRGVAQAGDAVAAEPHTGQSVRGW
jgi:hypothetical protein